MRTPGEGARRVIVGVDADGRSTVVADDATSARTIRSNGSLVQEIWRQESLPARVDDDGTRTGETEPCAPGRRCRHQDVHPATSLRWCGSGRECRAAGVRQPLRGHGRLAGFRWSSDSPTATCGIPIKQIKGWSDNDDVSALLTLHARVDCPAGRAVCAPYKSQIGSAGPVSVGLVSQLPSPSNNTSPSVGTDPRTVLMQRRYSRNGPPHTAAAPRDSGAGRPYHGVGHNALPHVPGGSVMEADMTVKHWIQIANRPCDLSPHRSPMDRHGDSTRLRPGPPPIVLTGADNAFRQGRPIA